MTDNKLEEVIITSLAITTIVLISWAFVEVLIYFFSHIYIGWK